MTLSTIDSKGVAEAVAFGYDMMSFGQEDERGKNIFCGTVAKDRLRVPHASGWSDPVGGLRRYAEDLVGYTIRDQDEQEVAIRSREYGVEIFAKVEAGRDTHSKYGMGRVMYARPAAHVGRQMQSWYHLGRGDQCGAAPVDGRAMWQNPPTHDLPDVAFITLNMDVWRAVFQSGLLAPGWDAELDFGLVSSQGPEVQGRAFPPVQGILEIPEGW